MCGRFSIVRDVEELERRFSIKIERALYKKMNNASPGQFLPVITDDKAEEGSFLKWGLIPVWAKEASIAYKMINARAETLSEKSSFKNLLHSRRCLIPADAFYEWQKTNAGKQPYKISLKNEQLFAFAGLWTVWRDKAGESIRTFTIITTEPNAVVSPVHNRMPVILEREKEQTWLKNKNDKTLLTDLFKPFNADLMVAKQWSFE